jgi:hypothetical protein
MNAEVLMPRQPCCSCQLALQQYTAPLLGHEMHMGNRPPVDITQREHKVCATHRWQVQQLNKPMARTP